MGKEATDSVDDDDLRTVGGTMRRTAVLDLERTEATVVGLTRRRQTAE
jgi:hypothetical protein